MSSPWKCAACFITNPADKLQCAACEAWNPNLSEAEIEAKKKVAAEKTKNLIAAFRGGKEASSSSPKASVFAFNGAPTSSVSFGFQAQPTSSSTTPSPPMPILFGVQPQGEAKGGEGSSPKKQRVEPAPISFGFAGGPAKIPSAPSSPKSPKNMLAASGGGGGFNPVLSSSSSGSFPSKSLTEESRWERKRGTPVCDVYVHGSGECEQLGRGKLVDGEFQAELERKKPSLVPLPSGVVSCSVGSIHSLAISESLGVYSWGCNDEGCLGRKGAEGQPQLIDFFEANKIQVKMVACGDSHSLFLDVEGGMYLCGTYKNSAGAIGCPVHTQSSEGGMGGLLAGTTSKKCVEPMKMLIDGSRTGTKKCQVQKVISGDDHSLCLLQGGKVYSWGNNEYGTLGNGQTDLLSEATETIQGALLARTSRSRRSRDRGLFPHPILWPRNGGKIKNVFATSKCSFIQTEKDEVYGCGLNTRGQLGIGTEKNSKGEQKNSVVNTFTLIPELSYKNIVDISGGPYHSMALTEAGEVYVWGKATVCGLGITNPSEDIPKPRKLSFPHPILSIASGGEHNLCSDSKGDVFTFGFGPMHQLGNCPRDVSNPEEVEKSKTQMEGQDEGKPYCLQSKALSSRFIVSCAGGSQHSLHLVWGKELKVLEFEKLVEEKRGEAEAKKSKGKRKREA